MNKLALPIIFLSFLLISSCGQRKEESAENNKTFSAEQIKAQSLKVNKFFDSIFDNELSRDPQRQTRLGIKTNYDKWTDISDEHDQRELEFVKADLEALHKTFSMDMMDEQAKISYRLFEKNCNEKIDNFKWRFHNYPVTQMEGFHSEVPAFLINMHTIVNKADAEAYIARLSAVNALFDQLIVNLKTREAKNIIPPKFVFPYVISDCKNILSGEPFEKGKPANALLEEETEYVVENAEITSEHVKT